MYCDVHAVEQTLLGSMQALGLRVPVSLVMARQPMPKALSPLQSDHRSYTSEFSVVGLKSLEFGVVFGESVAEEFGVWSSLRRRSTWRELVSKELLELLELE
jgi:hypothetical protein